MKSPHRQPAELATPSTTLDDLEPGAPRPLLDVAECVADQHPTLAGRVRVSTQTGSFWAPCMASVRPRVGDRVLLARIGADEQSVVLGVVDGLRERLAPAPAQRHVRRLRDDETVLIEAADGRPIVELRADSNGAVVRLLSADARLESAGRLEIAAESIALRATKGPIELESSEDVCVHGENIHLN